MWVHTYAHMVITNLVARIKKFTHRHRRIIGSLSAGLAVLILFASLRTSPPAALGVESLPQLGVGQVAVPITLTSSALSSSLRLGDQLDIVVPGESSYSRTLARNARVIDLPGGQGFSATASAVIVVAVTSSEGYALAAHQNPPLAVVITQR
jgi:hypothetical protein